MQKTITLLKSVTCVVKNEFKQVLAAFFSQATGRCDKSFESQPQGDFQVIFEF